MTGLFLQVKSLSAYSLFSGERPPFGWDLTLDPYYTSFEMYASMNGSSRDCLESEGEDEIYSYLLSHSFLPRFILLETAAYPLPLIGTVIRSDLADTYHRAQISENLNIIKAVCAGFEEPASISLFLGNLVRFTPANMPGRHGTAYSGYLFSMGTQHIKDNRLIEDTWYELEWKVKGERFVKQHTMKWSYRAGTKQHMNAAIKDVVYLSLLRDRVDLDTREASLLKNSSLEYTLDIDLKEQTVLRHLLLVGKSFPSRSGKYALQLKIGFIWEPAERYTGSLDDGDHQSFTTVIRPNIKF
jgi:hypothetical protein